MQNFRRDLLIALKTNKKRINLTVFKILKINELRMFI